MKITKYLFGLGLVAAMGLTACSNDDLTVGGQTPDSNESLYATVSLSLPTATGSRSNTIVPGEGDTSNSNSGSLDGLDYENKIKSIIVILATKSDDGRYLLQTVNQGDANVAAGSSVPTYVIKFSNNVIVSLANDKKSVYPFVICNPSADMVAKFRSYAANTGDFVNDIVSLQDADNFNGWRENNFLMTNSYIGDPISLPAPEDLKNYTNSNNPYNLTSAANGGPIKVERTVARFDFKSTKTGSLDANTYEILDAAKNKVGAVTITDMALINLAKDFYTFRRVSNDGTDKDWTIGGVETPANFMVSPNFSDLTAREFFLPGFNATGALKPSEFSYTSISSLGAADDNGYSIWRYATENAIPGEKNQKKGITTGVVFKGTVTFADSKIDTSKPVYKFGTTIYGNLDHLYAEIKANPNTFMAAQAKLAGLYTGIDAGGNLTGCVTDESTINTADGAQLSANGFTVFRPNDGKYEVYYYYWNRHNDNGMAGVMGKMEFGVVRNNVYRLAVNNINNIGHPGDPSDDPDPENPDDDDEVANLYISLDVQVLPWTVRVNNIEF